MSNTEELLKGVSKIEALIREHRLEISKAQFFSAHPEVLSISIERHDEYNDQGGTYAYLSVKDIKLTSVARLSWAKDYCDDPEMSLEDVAEDSYFSEYVAEEMGAASYFDSRDFDEYDTVEIERPGDMDAFVSTIYKRMVEALLPISVYAVMDRQSEYDDCGYHYVEGFELEGLYLNRAGAEERKTQIESENSGNELEPDVEIRLVQVK